jgi:hypothetical protein
MAGAGSRLDFVEAEEWFFGVHKRAIPSLAADIPSEVTRPALWALSHLAIDDDLLELLPYVLELHGPGSRLSVMRNPSTRAARQAKRENGVFYTPADVAEYMAEGVLSGRDYPLRCLDPSCGTGVFLVALLKTLSSRVAGSSLNRFTIAIQSLFGVDISLLAVESCAFVLLQHCLSDAKQIAPWSAWHALRLNLASTDSLLLRSVAVPHADYSQPRHDRDELKRRLALGEYVEHIRANLPTEQASVTYSLFDAGARLPTIGEVFPEAQDGFDVLLGNPPYATLGQREDGTTLKEQYSSFRGTNGKANLYPAFIEMMWRLTRPGGASSALVVPLSIAYHHGSQFRHCRQAMVANGGSWRFAFFDREPHALFGEDVKTRNAIIFRSELSTDRPRVATAEIETGPLRKWTSRTREKLLSSVSFTPIRHVSIANGIPKLSGGEQALVYSLLASRTDRLMTLCQRFGSCHPYVATLQSESPKVFVASTAYNFLNVFRSITLENQDYPLSDNTLHMLEFPSEECALIAFAILSSRLAYWLWHVEGDGFHVNAWFIQHLPFGRTAFTAGQSLALRDAGSRLWNAVQAHRIVSVNRNKQTVAYRPLACETERNAIDEVLIEVAKLPKRFNLTLQAFVRDTVIVDDTDVRRNRLKSLFHEPKESK